MFTKGKGGKGSPKGKGNSKGNRWTEPPWESNWGQAATGEEQNYRQWNPSPRSKGKGKGKHNADSGKAFNPQSLWCDIHQRYGHSTDWCFENPNRTDYGVKLAIDPDTQPIPALLPLSVSPPREREKPNLRATQSHTETVTGRVRTSRLTITLTRPLRHCTMNLPPRQRTCGGMTKNWDPL